MGPIPGVKTRAGALIAAEFAGPPQGVAPDRTTALIPGGGARTGVPWAPSLPLPTRPFGHSGSTMRNPAGPPADLHAPLADNR